jgi:MYXO-CTERM domain-containing protein
MSTGGSVTTGGASSVGGSAGTTDGATTDEAGCGCRVPAGRNGGSALSLLSLAALAAYWRRRRSRV